MNKQLVLPAVLLFLVSSLAWGQNSDPQALALAAQSLTAMTGGNAITDVTLMGNATWTVGGNQDQGPATLLALGILESKVDLQLGGGERTEIRDGSTGTPVGEWISGGTPTPFAPHNCWTDAVWFFPAFSSMVAAPSQNLVLTYVGLEHWQGTSVQHLQSYLYSPGKDQRTIQTLSTVDFYLDANSLLPIAETFNAHADSDPNVNIPMQILFLNYQTVNGAHIPFRVQKYFAGDLLLDVSISSALVNTGLPLSDFTVQ